MFKDECLESITIKSDIKEEKYVRDQLCQTKQVKCVDTGCQSIDRCSIEIQTDFDSVLPQSTRMKIDTSKSLTSFMLSVYPIISEQLLANARSHAFEGYEVDWEKEEEIETVSCMHTLHNESTSKDHNVTSLSWNCTGSVIAAALGSFNHDSWCVHQSFVFLWNIDRSNIDECKPDKMIDSDTCLMSIAFHPKQPALLAGGDFSGKVYIWDMSYEDNPLVAYSGKDSISHQEPVTNVLWTASSSLRTHTLISVGSDGQMLVWEFNQLRKELKLSRKFLMQSDTIPRSFRMGMTRNDLKIGITCLSPSFHDSSSVFIGMENGGVFKCSIDSKASENSSQSPVSQAYMPHSGTVNDIDVSPQFDNIFLTCASDMKVHIYNTQQVKPIVVIESTAEYLFKAHWSKTKATVFMITTSDGNLLVFDLMRNPVSPVNIIRVDEKKAGVHALACNGYQHNIIATGDSYGIIKVWVLPTILTQEKSSESSYFNNLETTDW